MPLLDRLLSDDVRLIIALAKATGYETALAMAAKKYPSKFFISQNF